MLLDFFTRPSLQMRITGLVTMVVLLALLIVGFSFSKIIEQAVEREIGDSAMETARFLSEMAIVRDAMKTDNPSAILYPLMEEYKKKTNAKFIVVLNNQGVRYNHHLKEEIGKPFTGGDEGPALQGKEYVSKAVGMSGPSIRAFTPILDPLTQEQLGVMVVGMFEKNLFEIASYYTPSILLWFMVALGVGILASMILARSIKNILHGLEPDQIAWLFKEREAMLECIGEGVVAIDRHARITVVNETARKMLSMEENPIGKRIDEVLEESTLPRILESNEKETNLEISLNDVSLLADRSPIKIGGKTVGAIAVFRDMTEVRKLAEELTGVRSYADGLRAKTHEFMNKLQTLSGLIELEEFEEAKRYIYQTTSKQQRMLQFLNRQIRDPKTTGLLIGKMQQAEELNIQITIDPGSYLGELPPTLSSDTLVLILGNLLQNAIDILKNEDKAGEIIVSVVDNRKEILIAVEDNGPGISQKDLPFIFNKGFSTKGSDRGYGLYLVKHQIERVAKGDIQVSTDEGEGTSFFVRLPKQPQPTNQSQPTG